VKEASGLLAVTPLKWAIMWDALGSSLISIGAAKGGDQGA
jgi:hypothetical protein